MVEVEIVNPYFFYKAKVSHQGDEVKLILGTKLYSIYMQYAPNYVSNKLGLGYFFRNDTRGAIR